MEIVPIEVFGIHVDVAFPAPLGFQAAKLEEFGAKICDPKEGLPLRAEHIRLRRFDELFDYEVKAVFFGENGTLTRTAERIKLGIRNARTQGDWNVIQQTFTRFYTLMDFDEKTLSHLCHPQARRLMEVTSRSLDEALAAVRAGARLGDVCHAVEKYATANGMSVVREFTGHGIGRHLHEEPSIPNFGRPGSGPVLKAGMTLAIEPMLCLGRADVVVKNDGWTAVSADGSLAAHFEHTVAVTEDGCEILTAAGKV